MKKLLSVTLVLALCIGLSAPASAMVEDAYEAQVQRALAEEYCITSKYDSVMENTNGDYALLIEVEGSDPALMPVGCVQVDLLDAEAVNEVLKSTDLSKETKSAIEQMASEAEPCSQCDDCNLITVFSPDLLPQTRGISTSYYTYHGTQMKLEQIDKADHAGFASIGGGTNAEAVWKSITNAVISVVGLASTPVAVFGAGLSLLDALYTISNCNNIYPAGGNDVQAKVRYTGTTRYTYAKMQDWLLGCVSRRVLIENIAFSYDFYEDMTRVRSGDFVREVNRAFQTESYSDHWAIAYANHTFAKVDAEIRMDLGSKTFVLYTP